MSPSAEIPCFWLTIIHPAANQTVNGVLVPWKIVPAVADTLRPQRPHDHRPSGSFHPATERHSGQQKPSGQRSQSGATKDLYAHEPLVGASGPDASKLLPGVHKVSSLAKRWLLGTHQGSVGEEHLAAYLDEFVFRFNRRRSRSRGLVFCRVLELAAGHDPVRDRDLIASPTPGRQRRPRPATRGRPPSLKRPRTGRPWRQARRTPPKWIPHITPIAGSGRRGARHRVSRRA